MQRRSFLLDLRFYSALSFWHGVSGGAGRIDEGDARAYAGFMGRGFSRFFAKGRWARGVLAWLVASLIGALAAAATAVVYFIARETNLHGPFPQSDWWVFTNLFWPFVMAGAALILVFGSPFALALSWLNRRLALPRPAGDIIFGALAGLGAVWLVLAIFHRLFSFGAN
jgi:hypothetical protein